MTAKELFSKHFNGLHYDDITREKIEKYAIEFAKFHAELALISAAEEADITDSGRFPIIDKSSILNAYPLTNIK